MAALPAAFLFLLTVFKDSNMNATATTKNQKKMGSP